jgi:hypothetical protein
MRAAGGVVARFVIERSDDTLSIPLSSSSSHKAAVSSRDQFDYDSSPDVNPGSLLVCEPGFLVSDDPTVVGWNSLRTEGAHTSPS